ncbi:MAG TPA: L,D-transpeptidase family protein, partial [Actinomycetota bacterium]|nr:L,D-transpeptidase family protein [Actinomycetota bacterium]
VIGGIPVGGMHIDDARETLREKFEDPLDRTVSLEANGQHWDTSARALGASSDLDERLSGIGINEGSTVVSRLWRRVTELRGERVLAVHVRVDRSRLDSSIDEFARTVDIAATSASPTLENGVLRIHPAVQGFELDRGAAVTQLNTALRSGESVVHLAGHVIAPPSSAVDDVLVVRIGPNVLERYVGESLVKTYRVATGSSEFPTPVGTFKVINRRSKPTWVNPAKFPGGWGWDLPASIPPGPGNPLGTRALDLNVSGIRIHGTYANYSLGYNASHGCIRMAIADVEELFDQIRVGTPVFITRSGALKPLRGRRPPPAAPSAENDASLVPGSGEPVASPSPTPSPSPSSPAPTPPDTPPGL